MRLLIIGTGIWASVGTGTGTGVSTGIWVSASTGTGIWVSVGTGTGAWVDIRVQVRFYEYFLVILCFHIISSDIEEDGEADII